MKHCMSTGNLSLLIPCLAASVGDKPVQSTGCALKPGNFIHDNRGGGGGGTVSETEYVQPRIKVPFSKMLA